LAQFFAKEDRFYRISAELRSSVVFTVHDVLAFTTAQAAHESAGESLVLDFQDQYADTLFLSHGKYFCGDPQLQGYNEARRADPGNLKKFLEPYNTDKQWLVNMNVIKSYTKFLNDTVNIYKTDVQDTDAVSSALSDAASITPITSGFKGVVKPTMAALKLYEQYQTNENLAKFASYMGSG
jgi:hypothetical protein